MIILQSKSLRMMFFFLSNCKNDGDDMISLLYCDNETTCYKHFCCMFQSHCFAYSSQLYNVHKLSVIKLKYS